MQPLICQSPAQKPYFPCRPTHITFQHADIMPPCHISGSCGNFLDVLIHKGEPGWSAAPFEAPPAHCSAADLTPRPHNGRRRAANTNTRMQQHCWVLSSPFPHALQLGGMRATVSEPLKRPTPHDRRGICYIGIVKSERKSQSTDWIGLDWIGLVSSVTLWFHSRIWNS